MVYALVIALLAMWGLTYWLARREAQRDAQERLRKHRSSRGPY